MLENRVEVFTPVSDPQLESIMKDLTTTTTTFIKTKNGYLSDSTNRWHKELGAHLELQLEGTRLTVTLIRAPFMYTTDRYIEHLHSTILRHMAQQDLYPAAPEQPAQASTTP